MAVFRADRGDVVGPRRRRCADTNLRDLPVAVRFHSRVRGHCKYTFACRSPVDQIQAQLRLWTDTPTHTVDVILTSGGTGFGQRDLTPEAVRPLLEREAPGVAQALLAEGLKFTPLAVLSRPVAGTRKNVFICTLPGR